MEAFLKIYENFGNQIVFVVLDLKIMTMIDVWFLIRTNNNNNNLILIQSVVSHGARRSLQHWCSGMSVLWLGSP